MLNWRWILYTRRYTVYDMDKTPECLASPTVTSHHAVDILNEEVKDLPSRPIMQWTSWMKRLGKPSWNDPQVIVSRYSTARLTCSRLAPDRDLCSYTGVIDRWEIHLPDMQILLHKQILIGLMHKTNYIIYLQIYNCLLLQCICMFFKSF